MDKKCQTCRFLFNVDNETMAGNCNEYYYPQKRTITVGVNARGCLKHRHIPIYRCPTSRKR